MGPDGAPYGKQCRAISSSIKSIQGEAERKTARRRFAEKEKAGTYVLVKYKDG